MAPAPSNQRRGQGVAEVLRHCHRGAICGVVTPVPQDQIGRRRGGKQSLKIAQIAAAVGVAKKDPLDVGGKILQASPTRATVTAPRLTDHLRTAEACTRTGGVDAAVVDHPNPAKPMAAQVRDYGLDRTLFVQGRDEDEAAILKTGVAFTPKVCSDHAHWQ